MATTSELPTGAIDLPAAAPALKEWAAIWSAVIAGRQIVDLRKGGIAESTNRFQLRAARFWLYPSAEHQREDLLKPDAREFLDAQPSADQGQRISLPGWAEVVAAAQINDADLLRSLSPEFIWTDEYAASRFRWRPAQPLHLLVLRAYRLREPLSIPARHEYAGCTSWVDLRDVPADLAELAAEPALSDAAFAERFEKLLARPPAGVELFSC